MKYYISIILLFSQILYAQHSVQEASSQEKKSENASNPLAAVSNIDLVAKYFDLEDGNLKKYSLEGATMINPKLKFKYEVHYWDIGISGNNEQDLESTSLKLIYFPKEGITVNSNPYRLAIGVEWIYDFDNTDKGIGTGSDTISLFGGAAISVMPGLMLTPLIQHYESYNGNDLRLTAARLVVLKNLAEESWMKMDFKVPYDWNTYKIESAIEM